MFNYTLISAATVRENVFNYSSNCAGEPCALLIAIATVFPPTTDAFHCSRTATGVTNTLAFRLLTNIYLTFPLGGCEIWHATFWGKLHFLYFHTVYHVNFGTNRALKFDFIHFYYQFWRCQINICFIPALESRGPSLFFSPHKHTHIRCGTSRPCTNPHVGTPAILYVLISNLAPPHHDIWRNLKLLKCYQSVRRAWRRGGYVGGRR